MTVLPLPARERPPWAMLAVLLVGIALCRVGVLTSDWGYDAGAWLYISRLMGEGQRPYVDIWDNKLPPILWIGRLVLASGAPHLAMFALDVAFTLAGVLGIASLLLSLGAGRRAALLFGGLHAIAALPAWEGPHRLEVYSVGCMAAGLAAIVAAGRTAGGRRARRLALAGACLAAAASFRPQEVVSAAVLGAFLLRSMATGRARALGAYALGGAAFAGLLAGAAAAGGYLGAMIETAVLGSLRYATGAGAVDTPTLGKTIHSLRGNVEQMPVAWLAASAGCLLVAGAFRAAPRRERDAAALAVALFAAHVAVTFLSGMQWTHYHYPVGWSACLLLGTGWTLWRRGQPAFHPTFGVRPEVLLACALLVTVPATRRVYAGLHRLLGDEPESRTDRLERLVRAHVPPDEGLLIADSYDVIGVLLRLPHPRGSYWAVGAPQFLYGDPARAEAEPDPSYAINTLWGGRLAEHLAEEGADWVVRDPGHADRLSAVLEREFEKRAETPEFELWRRVARRAGASP